MKIMSKDWNALLIKIQTWHCESWESGDFLTEWPALPFQNTEDENPLTDVDINETLLDPMKSKCQRTAACIVSL